MAHGLAAGTIRKIAVLRANALGDFIFVLPALRALRQTFPQAEIAYLGKQWHAAFAPGRVDEIERVVVIPPYPGVGEPEDFRPDQQQVIDFFEHMRQERFDLAFQMHGGGKHSNPFLLQLGARLTAGTSTPDAPPLDRSTPYVFYQNEVLRYLEIASLVGARTEHIVPNVHVLPEDRDEAAALRDAREIRQPYIVIHPGASDPRRRWPADRFGSLANHYHACGFTVAVTGTAAEAEVVAAVCKTAPDAISLTNTQTLGGLAALLAEAALVISNDTGPLHLASAVGAKTVGIYWVGNLITGGHVTHNHDLPLISWTVACPRCGTSCVGPAADGKRSCNHQDSFVTDVSVDAVLASADRLLTQPAYRS